MPSKPSFKTALITGAYSGLGQALAQFLETQGIECILTGRRDVDLSNRTDRHRLLDIIDTKTPDLVINNAGFGLYGPTLDLSIQEQLDMIEVNISALVEMTHRAASALLKAKKRGTILNISSAGAFIPFPTFNVYCASKAFVNSFSLALDAELRSQGVRVLCACPGQIATAFRQKASKGLPQEKDHLTMPVDKAVAHLWKQIQKQKGLYVFGWRAKILVWTTKFVPKKLLNPWLIKSLKRRYTQTTKTKRKS